MSEEQDYEAQFGATAAPHVVMITNHGVHEWEIEAGLPDTGGQNVYVNYLSHTLGRLGFRVTTYNRGGYPHPTRGTAREGTSYLNARERIIYLTDSRSEFIRKEDMAPQIDELAAELAEYLAAAPEPELIVSHYWDGAAVAEAARKRRGLQCPHVWIPHSLGALKKEGTDPTYWPELRLDERIAWERGIARAADFVAATSRAMRENLIHEYGIEEPLFFPPCVDATRFDREAVRKDRSAAELLAKVLSLSPEEVEGRRIITEVSRTDHTKRKDILIEAFARIHREFPDTLLAVTIDQESGELYRKLLDLISQRGVRDSVAVLGSIWDYIPSLYGMTAIYSTPSIMEGFGMSIQEAAACGVPGVASRRVPFAVEYLLGDSPESRRLELPNRQVDTMDVGVGAVVVPPDSVDGLVAGLRTLLADEELRRRMGETAHRITIPRFTWREVTRRFLAHVGISEPSVE